MVGTENIILYKISQTQTHIILETRFLHFNYKPTSLRLRSQWYLAFYPFPGLRKTTWAVKCPLNKFMTCLLIFQDMDFAQMAHATKTNTFTLNCNKRFSLSVTWPLWTQSMFSYSASQQILSLTFFFLSKINSFSCSCYHFSWPHFPQHNLSGSLYICHESRRSSTWGEEKI